MKNTKQTRILALAEPIPFTMQPPLAFPPPPANQTAREKREENLEQWVFKPIVPARKELFKHKKLIKGSI